MSTIREIIALLDPQEQRSALGLLALIILMAFVEMLGVASILPFMAVLSNPESIETNRWLHWGYETFNFQSQNRYLFFLGLIVLMVLVVSNVLKALTRWQTLHFSFMCGHSISHRLFAHYLSQPYSFFLQRNTADIAKNVLSEVQMLVKDVFVPVMNLIAQGLITTALLALLLAINPILAITAALVLGGAYSLVYVAFNKRIRYHGGQRQKAQAKRYKVVNEAVQGIKNIKLTAHEPTYLHYFDKSSRRYAASQSKAGTMGEIPRYALELIGFGGILLIVLYLLLTGEGLNQALPLMALYAFAGYRLMPSLQNIYLSLSRMRFSAPIIEAIIDEFKDVQSGITLSSPQTSTQNTLPFAETIKLSGITFRYQGMETNVLKDINLTIPANSTIGIVGQTGSGKTTLVDIILGLLRPDHGNILIDGTALTDENLQNWQQNLAYVSQHIYLCDDSIRRNIAFGVAEADIDEAKIRRAAHMACIDDFIESELPAGYDTIIGENGIRLSGGQRQRIGLARALYLNRPVLVLDEATSALDTETEDNIMEEIEGLSGQKTIIMIAHRTRTVEKCDQVIKVEKGKIIS